MMAIWLICSVIVESIVNTTRLLIVEFQDIRGNLNTRFRKLDADDGPYSAIILAAAGVKRLGWENRISSYLHQKVCLHAVGQGALAIECRKQDWYMINVGYKFSLFIYTLQNYKNFLSICILIRYTIFLLDCTQLNSSTNTYQLRRRKGRNAKGNVNISNEIKYLIFNRESLYQISPPSNFDIFDYSLREVALLL